VPEGHCPSGRPPWVVCWGGFSGYVLFGGGMIYRRLWLGSASNYWIINIFIFKDLVLKKKMSLFFNFFILQVWQGLLKFSKNYLNLDLQITPFFKNKHFEFCCFVMYRVRNIVNRRESDVICHSVRRSRVPTNIYILS